MIKGWIYLIMFWVFQGLNSVIENPLQNEHLLSYLLITMTLANMVGSIFDD